MINLRPTVFSKNEKVPIPRLQDDSNLLNNGRTIISESREEYLTCESSSTVPHIGYLESRKVPIKQSLFDTSFLPPPPPRNVFVGSRHQFRSNQIATLNIQMDSYMGPIQSFRGDYVINPIK